MTEYIPPFVDENILCIMYNIFIVHLMSPLCLNFQTSISFVHEIGTRVRISLMRSISRRQKDRDPQAVCSISAFSARPLLRYNFTATRSIHFHRRWVMTSLMCILLVRTIKNI